MGIIIASINNKGGVGKTTFTVNIAASLSKQKKSVLVVDLDPQSNSTQKLLPRSTRISNSVFELLDNESTCLPRDTIYATEMKGCFIIPNISETANLEPELIANFPASLYILREKLRELCISKYDYTILDCPPNMGTFVLLALNFADIAVIPIRAGSTDSVSGLGKITELISEIQAETNKDLKGIRILVNALDKRTGIGTAVQAGVMDTFGDLVFQTVIPINTAIEKAEALNETIFKHHSNSSSATAYRALTKEIMAGL